MLQGSRVTLGTHRRLRGDDSADCCHHATGDGLGWLSVLLVFAVFLFDALHPYDPIPWVIKKGETSFAITGLRRSDRQFARERTLRLPA